MRKNENNIDKTQIYTKRFEARMRKNGIVPPDDITVGKLHCYDTEGVPFGCILDTETPPIGCYCGVDGKIGVWTPTSRDKRKEAIYISKKMELRQLLENALSGTNAGKEKSSLDTTNKSEFGSTNDIAIVSKDDADIAFLAAMKPLEFSRVVKAEALEMKVSVSDLRKVVIAEQKRAMSSLVLGPQLVRDLYNILCAKKVERIRTAEAYLSLCADNSLIWSKYWSAGDFTARKMSLILTDLGISSTDMRINGSGTLKGFSKEQFEDALSLIKSNDM